MPQYKNCESVMSITKLCAGFFAIMFSLALSAADENRPDQTAPTNQENISKLMAFQRREIFSPLAEQIDNLVSSQFATLVDLASSSTLNIEVFAVETISDALLKEEERAHNAIAFLDLDETLLFGSNMGWIVRLFAIKDSAVVKSVDDILRNNGGFTSRMEFYAWFDKTFPAALSTNSAGHIDGFEVVSEENLKVVAHLGAKNIDVYALTARKMTSEQFTLNQLKLNNLNLDGRRRLRDLDMLPTGKHVDGVVFNTGSNKKFGTNGTGIATTRAHLNNLPPDQKSKRLDVIVADNSFKVFNEILSLENVTETKRLENEFDISIHYKFIQPLEEKWRAAQHLDIWDAVEKNFDVAPSEIAFDMLREFLKTFNVKK